MKKGDIIKFGKYPPKDNDSFRTPIEWLVLDVKGNEASLSAVTDLTANDITMKGTI